MGIRIVDQAGMCKLRGCVTHGGTRLKHLTHSEHDVERAANRILGTSNDIGVEVARDNNIVHSRAKNHDRAVWLRRACVKVESVVAAIITDRDIARRDAASQLAYPFEI